MTIIEDMGNKINKHNKKNQYWQDKGIEVLRYPLPTGDYVLLNSRIKDVINRKLKRGNDVKKIDLLGTYDIAIDTKESIVELYGNLVGSHERFRDELILAKNNGIKLIILVENQLFIKSIDDFEKRWINPRKLIWENDTRKDFEKLIKANFNLEKALLYMINNKLSTCIVPNSNFNVRKVYDSWYTRFRKNYLDCLKRVRFDDVVAFLKKNDIKVKRPPVNNKALATTMRTMEKKYGCVFMFCAAHEAGSKVIELLKGGVKNDLL